MEAKHQSSTIYLRTITPLHIGTGEQLYALDYVLHRNTFFRVSQKAFVDFLIRQPGGNDLIQTYSNWIERTTNHLENLRQTRERDALQERSRLQRNFNLLEFCRENRIESAFLEYLQNNHEIPQYPFKGRAQLKQQVRGLITTADQKIFIPGSSIKGAIRTAMLYQVLMHGDENGEHKKVLINDINAKIEDFRTNPKQLAKTIGSKVEHSIAFCLRVEEKTDRETGQKRKIQVTDDVQYDLFKFLHVSDAILETSASIHPVEVVNTDLFIATKVRDRNGNLSLKATFQPQSPAVEVITKGNVFKLSINFCLEQLYSIYRVKKNDQWIGIEEKVRDLFGVDLTTVTLENLHEKKREGELFIKSAIANFSRAISGFEKQWLEKQYFSAELDTSQRLSKEYFLKGFSPVFTKIAEGKTLLRVGFANGFASHTELLYMLTNGGVETRMALEKVMTRFEIGKKLGPSSGRSSYRPDLSKFPKSRMLANYGEEISPLGWMEWSESSDNDIDTDISIAETKGRHSIESASKEIIPEFLSKPKLKPGDIIDAILIKADGKKKTFKLFLSEKMNPSTQELEMNYFSELVAGGIYKVRVNALSKNGLVQAISFVGRKS